MSLNPVNEAPVARRRSRLSHIRTTDLEPAAAAAVAAASSVESTTEVVEVEPSSPSRCGEWLRGAVKQAYGMLGSSTDQVDPLVALVRHDPAVAAWFIQVLMFAGAVLSTVASGVAIALLTFRWSGCGHCCDRPLRLWLAVHAGLQAVQVPVRFHFSSKVYAVRRLSGNSPVLPVADAERLEGCVACFTAMWAWRMIRLISLITYGWMALGLVWVMNASPCTNCPSGIRLTCVAMMGLVGLKALLVAELFNKLFGNASTAAEAQDQDGACAESQAATPEEIAALPNRRYRDIKCTALGSNHTACVVCCSEYADRDLCRILPCGHHFHQHCVDKWLLRSTRCPLCMGSIREAPKDKTAPLTPPASATPSSPLRS
jgi:hypothetical protein